MTPTTHAASTAARPDTHVNGDGSSPVVVRPAAQEALLTSAIREGATRATVAAGLGALAVIHAVDAVGKWSETRYVFWLYMGAILSAVAIGGWAILTRSRTALLAAAGLSASVLLGYVINRTVGLPGAMDDIGNWTEPLGLASMVVEVTTVAVALAAYTLGGARSRA